MEIIAAAIAVVAVAGFVFWTISSNDSETSGSGSDSRDVPNRDTDEK